MPSDDLDKEQIKTLTELAIEYPQETVEELLRDTALPVARRLMDIALSGKAAQALPAIRLVVAWDKLLRDQKALPPGSGLSSGQFKSLQSGSHVRQLTSSFVRGGLGDEIA